MKKKLLSILSMSLFCLAHADAPSSGLQSAKESLTKVVDFMKYPTPLHDYVTFFNDEAWEFGCYAFNQAPELTPFFARLKMDYQIDTLIETGTFQGGSTVAFSFLFKDVYTIEIQEETFKAAQAKLKKFPNIQCLLGSSEQVLKKLLPSLKKKNVMFYLDAHWNQHWPLLEELEEISKTHKDRCVIVIDDFKVPGRLDIPYDKYGEHECSLEYVKEKLGKIFSSYTVEYLIPRSMNSKAKIIIAPTSLAPERLKTK